MTPPAHCYAVVRRQDGRLEWLYNATGFAPADAVYVTTSWSQAVEFIRREEAVERERADAKARAQQQTDLFGR
jgi:hypothetical protein